MKKILIIACFLLLAKTGLAHQPQSIAATYDSKAKSLAIKIEHSTQNRKEHFVRRVIIRLNDKEIFSKNFFFQSSNTGIEMDIPLDAKPEDQVTIFAYSEKGGILDQSFAVAAISIEDEATSPENPTQTHGSLKKKKSY